MGTLGVVCSVATGMQYDLENCSACSTPYVSAPSSPGRPAGGGFFFSAPSSPMRSIISSSCRAEHTNITLNAKAQMDDDDDFDFSARFVQAMGGSSPSSTSMSSADELFHNGKIRPMKLSSHLQRPQHLSPLIDFPDEEGEQPVEGEKTRGRDEGSARLGRERSVRGHRRTRSLSPLRSTCQWDEAADAEPSNESESKEAKGQQQHSSSGRRRGGSRRWSSIKDLFLYRSKSEGRGNTKERLWNLSFTNATNWASTEKEKQKQQQSSSSSSSKKQESGKVGQGKKGQGGQGHPQQQKKSAHELHYTANRAQYEELRRKTYLPYRQGLLGCLGFPSKSYTTVNGIARSLHPLSS
eukprot:TRINITY_DN37709_c0_g1_i1.p1 TRINITY_DN37709_c0_g1~~TRINITY_DN37709_c0_g1_i1.p1  ORF type:complete len:353 (+),score=8.60 TRINITY_DN37709_c0_g1_i1:528-1586(+)